MSQLRPIRALFLLGALAAIPACNRPAPPAPPGEPQPTPPPESPADPRIAPAPRLVPPAAEPSDAKDALEVYVTRGANGIWNAQYPTGQRVVVGGEADKLSDKQRLTVSYLVLPVGKPVKFFVTAEEGTGAFAIPAFPVAVTADEGKFAHATVKPARQGKFAIRNGHQHVGEAYVVREDDFEGWLAGMKPPQGLDDDPVDGSAAQRGQQLFLKLQCSKCHSGDARATAPNLEGLWGKKERLKGGGAVIVDAAYIKDSIRKPKAHVVEGWEAIMPLYDATKVTEEEVRDLIAFIRAGGMPRQTEPLPPPVGGPPPRPKNLAPPPRKE